MVNCQLVCQLAKFCSNVGSKAASVLINIHSGFPLGLENGKAFSSEGNVRVGISHKILEKSGNSRQMLFIIF